MAYDQHAAYQAPQRHYYPQEDHRAPPQQQRGYDQGYGPRLDAYQDQGYNNGYGHVQDHGQAYRGPPQQHGNQRMRQEPGPRGPAQQGGGHRMMQEPGPRGPPQNYGRDQNGYDHRQERGPRQLYSEPQFANSMPHHHNLGPPSPAMQSTHSLDLPRTGGQSRQKQRPPPLDRSGSDNSFTRRPFIEPVSPTELPQDNAFPTFPVAKKKASKATLRDDSRPPPAARGAVRPDGQINGPLSPPLTGRPNGPSHQNSYESQASRDPRQIQNAPARPPMQSQGSSESRRQMDMPMRPGTAPNGHRGSPLAGHANVPPQQHARNHSQSEIYADYYGSDLQPPHAPPRNRDSEIERNMPDFDGPGRNIHSARPIDEHLAKAPVHAPSPVQRQQSPPQQNIYQHQTASHSAPNVRGPPGRTPGPGMGPHPANQPPQPYQNSYASRDPYANSRQAMGQASNGYGPRPPPQRPGTADAYGRPNMDRNRSNESAMSQPGRAPSAPPAQGYGSPGMHPQHSPSPRSE